jgi:hypothetical protein
MKISATVQNGEGQHHVTLRTNDNVHSLAIPPKLMSHTDRVAEIQNTLRVETPVLLSSIEGVTV